MKLEKINVDNINEIYQFEKKNKNYFEKTLPPRPKEYLNYDSFELKMKEIIKEQYNKQCLMYIIRDDFQKIIGRINLHSIDLKDKKAELGYRISEKEQGKGYATKAIQLIINLGVKELGLKLIEAGTSTENYGSQKVLVKNGFEMVGKEEKVMKVNNRWIDGYWYKKYIKN